MGRQHTQCGGAGQRLIYILGVRESDGMRFHHVPQNDVRFKAYELFMSGICHLIFLDHCGSPQIRDITV